MSPDTAPTGMVDALPATPRARTPFEQSLLEFLLSTGPQDARLMARVMDPKLRAEYEAAIVARRATDWPHLGMYRADNAALQSPPDVVFAGDSITEIWQHSDDELFSDGVIGRGISGQTSPQLLVRFYPDVIALRPKVVHILCGSNDIAGNTGPTTPQDYKNNVTAMLDLAQANNIAVLLASILPSAQPASRPPARTIELNAWLRHTAADRGAVYVDYHSAMADADGSLPIRYSNDGLHPNHVGYSVMRPLAQAAVRAALNSIDRSSRA